jgi:hypothetical protein
MDNYMIMVKINQCIRKEEENMELIMHKMI